MPKSSTSWGKGKSGNPAGRKPKGRALTEILQKAGSKTVEVGGKKVASRQAVADMLWQLAATGKAVFPDSTPIVASKLSIVEWLSVVKFLYQHIDGPPKAELDVTSDGKPLNKRPDYSNLTVAELKQLRELNAKLTGEATADDDVEA